MFATARKALINSTFLAVAKRNSVIVVQHQETNMATKVDIAGTNLSASQLSEFFRLAALPGSHVTRSTFQAYIEGRNCFSRCYELYLAPRQKDGKLMRGFDLEKHLQKNNFIGRAFSLDDVLVRGWIANPETYPKEFKEKAVFLWKSAEDRSCSRSVPSLCWDDRRVEVSWIGLGSDWNDYNPALLASA